MRERDCGRDGGEDAVGLNSLAMNWRRRRGLGFLYKTVMRRREYPLLCDGDVRWCKICRYAILHDKSFGRLIPYSVRIRWIYVVVDDVLDLTRAKVQAATCRERCRVGILSSGTRAPCLECYRWLSLIPVQQRSYSATQRNCSIFKHPSHS